MQVAGDPDAAHIGLVAMAGAIEVVTFYIGEHLRLTGASIEHRRLAQLQGLAAWFRDERQPVKNADLLQRVTRPIRALKAEGIKRLVDELAQRGYIRAVGGAWEVRHGV